MQLRPGTRRIFDADLPDDLVEELTREIPLSIVILEAIDELMRRNPEGNRPRCRALFRTYVETRQADLDSELAELADEHGLDAETDDAEVDAGSAARAEVFEIARSLRHARVDERMLDRLMNGEVDLQRESPLKLFGYSVSSAAGLGPKMRAELLEDFWAEGKIPALFPEDYRKTWGGPRSKQRKARMTSHLEFLASFFERNDSIRFANAIAKWKKDVKRIEAFPAR